MADTTLDGAVAAGDLDITVAAALSSADGDFLVQVGEEFLLVERRGATLNPQVRRGMFGTAVATHAPGDDVIHVTPVVQTGTPGDPPAVIVAPSLADVLAVGAAAGSVAITGLAAPSGDQDAATKKYVDDAIAAALP